MNALPFTLWLESEHWLPKPDDDPEDEFCNIRIDLAGGEAYALNVWTFRYLERARREGQRAGKSLGGRYLIGPDLIVGRLDRATMEAVVSDLAGSGQLKPEWRVAAETETSAA